MKKLNKIIVLITTTIIILSCTACKQNGSAVDFSFFNTIIHVETHDYKMSKETENKLNNLFSTLDREFDANRSNSAVYKINNAEKNQPVQISARFLEIFNLSAEYNAFTDNLFNPAIYPLIKLWQFDNYPALNFTLPKDEDILSLLSEKTDFSKFHLNTEDADNLSISKSVYQLSIDFGGILKGYAVDKAFEILSDSGHKKGYINIGGSSLYLLNVNSLTIRHPRATANVQTILSINADNLKNVAVSTSGDYERYYTYNGKNYNHIISPNNGYPTDTGVISATVIGTSGAFGDAITTALCLTEHQYGKTDSSLITLMKKIIERYPDCQIYAVYDKGGKKEIATNKKQGEHFTLLDTNYTINEIV